MSVISALTFHILFIWFLSLFFLMRLANSLFPPPHLKPTTDYIAPFFLKKFLLPVSYLLLLFIIFFLILNLGLVSSHFRIPLSGSWASLVVLIVKNQPAMQETQVWLLSQEDTLEKQWLHTPVFSSGEFHGQRAWWATVHGSQRVRQDWVTNTCIFFTFSL